jgi:colanic acid/amylovoran biosynthesis protein
MAKKIRLYAYTKGNLGDDLFVRHIVRRYPKVQFFINGELEKAHAFREEKNLKVINEDPWLVRQAHRIRPSLAARLRNYLEQSYDAVVYIGGSIFIEYSNWETILTWWRYEAEHCVFFAIGSNFGPWHTEEYLHQMGEIFGKMQDVCFRDHYSERLFSAKKTVRYAPDILLDYPMPHCEMVPGKVFISVINCEEKDEGENKLSVYEKVYTKQMACVADRLIETGYKVVFSSFCSEEGDERQIDKIAAIMKHPGEFEKCCYMGENTDEVLREITSSEWIVAARFHAMILGFAAGRPVIPVVYSEKTKHVLEDIGFTGRFLDIHKLMDAAIFPDSLFSEKDIQLLNNRQALSVKSREHFLALDRFLGYK